MQKYGHDDARPILERASARETAARVAVGELARRFLAQARGAEVLSHVVAIGSVTVPAGTLPGPADRAAIDADPVRCLDPATSAAMVPRSRRPARTATRSAAWSRWSCTGCRPASAATCTGTGGSTPGSPAR